jgi:6-phosphogluconolactonase (cycloisomerase 2 family)
LTNQVAGNQIAVFHRAENGALSPAGLVSAGGIGTGGGLGSQGALVLSEHNRWLAVVNAGSDTIALFAVTHRGLERTALVPSGGSRPISLTIHGDLLYVLNAGGTGNITGFRIGYHGELTPLAGSTRPLSSPTANPAQVQFSPDGQVLVVTEKATSIITTYVVGKDGLAGSPVAHPSSGATPFGFGFAGLNHLIVSEAGQRAVSSYTVKRSGEVRLVSGSVPTDQIAACWIAVTRNGRFAYTTNAGSGSITGYRVQYDGSLTRLGADPTGITGPGSTPLDMALDHGSRFLYVLEGGDHTIGAFAVNSDGSLTPMAGAGVLPAGTVGLAAR